MPSPSQIESQPDQVTCTSDPSGWAKVEFTHLDATDASQTNQVREQVHKALEVLKHEDGGTKYCSAQEALTLLPSTANSRDQLQGSGAILFGTDPLTSPCVFFPRTMYTTDLKIGLGSSPSTMSSAEGEGPTWDSWVKAKLWASLALSRPDGAAGGRWKARPMIMLQIEGTHANEELSQAMREDLPELGRTLSACVPWQAAYIHNALEDGRWQEASIALASHCITDLDQSLPDSSRGRCWRLSNNAKISGPDAWDLATQGFRLGSKKTYTLDFAFEQDQVLAAREWSN